MLTFKSLRQPLDVWAVQELVGHYVAYRKFVSQRPGRLLNAAEFRLVAATMRFPAGLAGQLPLRPVAEGVYDLESVIAPVRVVVTRAIPPTPGNAVWNLFSGRPEFIAHGRDVLRSRLAKLTSTINRLFEFYQLEGVHMAFSIEQFKRELDEDYFQKMSAERRLAGLAPEERLAGLAPEQRLAGLTPEQLDVLRRLLNEPASRTEG